MKWRMILAVIYATFAVAKRKSEKKGQGFESRTSLSFFFHFIFVLFLYFFYHFPCRKDQFIVLSLKISDL